MKPKKFKEVNSFYGKGQDYKTLPACKLENGDVVTCWKLSWKDLVRVLFNREIWVVVKTFNSPLQPMYISTEKLVEEE